MNLGAESNLGIVVEPSQVRLLPDSQDGYVWSVRPERKHLLRKNLFKKQLSKHAVGAYMELCHEVGKSFDAVRLAPLTNKSCDYESEVRLPCQPPHMPNVCAAIRSNEFRY